MCPFSKDQLFLGSNPLKLVHSITAVLLQSCAKGFLAQMAIISTTTCMNFIGSPIWERHLSMSLVGFIPCLNLFASTRSSRILLLNLDAVYCSIISWPDIFVGHYPPHAVWQYKIMACDLKITFRCCSCLAESIIKTVDIALNIIHEHDGG